MSSQDAKLFLPKNINLQHQDITQNRILKSVCALVCRSTPFDDAKNIQKYTNPTGRPHPA